ncbi:class I SAM-dependent methyltransferase [Thermococcus piezophilus]|uniref:class I SAM-dependent methyltransferase n=1 Tax=Thermococcus piezophilus TaxID=1712654 RepID=UPI000AC7D7EF|nr:class I SAM-dependent methyltransferase [Thermococcus piezophilus]
MRLERISQEIDFVERIFRNDARREVRHVLDIACGTGAPTLELVRRGYEVVGLDINEEMLTVAREKARREELSVEFMLGDAAALDFREEFDAVTMFFSSILYLNEDRINELFNSVIKALRPGGVFVADWSNLLFYRDRAFFTHENLNVYTAREMRLLAEKHFDEVIIYGDFQRELPANAWRLWLVGIKGQAP